MSEYEELLKKLRVGCATLHETKAAAAIEALARDRDALITNVAVRDKIIDSLQRCVGTNAEKMLQLVRERDALREALDLLVKDVADYPTWWRPCHALDVARAALKDTAMSHEPTNAEALAASLAYENPTATWAEALTAANALRDKRIRAEALEEAAAHFEDVYQLWRVAAVLRRLKDKTDE